MTVMIELHCERQVWVLKAAHRASSSQKFYFIRRLAEKSLMSNPAAVPHSSISVDSTELSFWQIHREIGSGFCTSKFRHMNATTQVQFLLKK